MKLTDGQVKALRNGIEDVTSYLELGGLFNPELMDHNTVRDMLMDFRDLASELLESRAEIERLIVFGDNAIASTERICLRCSAAEARVTELEDALAQARAWHESEAKALSKSGRSDADYHWRRGGHADQIADIKQFLPDAEYHAALDRINARAALETIAKETDSAGN